MRPRLDTFLAEQATASGIESRDAAAVDEIVAPGGSIAARVGPAPQDAGCVVGADVANGVVARTFGLGTDIRLVGNM